MFDVKEDLKVYSKKIFWALKHNENETVMFLLKGVNISKVRDSYKRSLLHISAASGNLLITEYLIKSQCSINAIDDDGNTPLLLAVYFSHLEVIRLLINAGADVCIANFSGRSPIFYAKEENDSCILKVLLSELKKKRRCKAKVLNFFMLVKWQERNLSEATSSGSDGRLFYTTRLQQTSLYGERQMFGSYDLLQLPLNKAIFLRDMYQIRMSLKYGADPLEADGNGCTALHAAATFMSDANELVQLILDHGGQIDIKNSRGVTPLHVAAAFCNADFIKLLLRRGADIELQDVYGRTPLNVLFLDSHRAIINRNRALRLLLRYGANINSKPAGQCSILERSVTLKDSISRNFLLKYLARVTCQGSYVADYYFDTIEKHQEMRIYYAECKQELHTMMNIKVFGTISFLNVLIDDISKIASYARNERFVHAFETTDLEKTFLKYHKFLKIRFNTGLQRMKLMTTGATLLSNILPFFSPDHLIIQKILNYFKLSDLQKLCA